MHRTCCLWLLLVLGCTVRAQDQVLEKIHPGMLQMTIENLLQGTSLGKASYGSISGLPKGERYLLDRRRSLIIDYPGDHEVEPSSRAIAVHIVDAAELFPGLSGDALADVLMVNQAPVMGKGFAGDQLLRSALWLHRAGRVRILAALRTYVAAKETPAGKPMHLLWRRLWEIGWDDNRVAWLCRLLFVPRDEGRPWTRPALGTLLPAPTGTVWPTYPLIVADGLPFLVVGGYVLGGLPEPASRSIDFSETVCAVVATLPSPDLEPIAAGEALIAGSQLKRAFGKNLQGAVDVIRSQALAMRIAGPGGTSFRPHGLATGCCNERDIFDQGWQEIVVLAQKSPQHWDDQLLLYVAGR